MELQRRAANSYKRVAQKSCREELQKDLQIQFTTKRWNKELETEIAERSCQIQLRKGDGEARDDDKAGNGEKSRF